MEARPTTFRHRPLSLSFALAACVAAGAFAAPAHAAPTAAAAVRTSPTSAGLLFFDGTHVIGATGAIDAQGHYTAAGPLPGFSAGWTHIVRTKTGMLLFYKASTGEAWVARLDAAGHYTPIGSVLPASGRPLLGVGWTHIVAAGNGGLFFYNASTGAAQTALLGANGTIANVTPLSASTGWTHLVGTGNGVILAYNASNGAGGTGLLDPSGRYQYVGPLSGFGTGWTHIASANDGSLVFYDASHATGWTALLDASGHYHDVGPLNGFSTNGWTHVIGAANGALLFYNASSGAAFTATIDVAGHYTPGAPATIAAGYTLISSADGGAGRTVSLPPPPLREVPPPPTPVAPPAFESYTPLSNLPSFHDRLCFVAQMRTSGGGSTSLRVDATDRYTMLGGAGPMGIRVTCVPWSYFTLWGGGMLSPTISRPDGFEVVNGGGDYPIAQRTPLWSRNDSFCFFSGLAGNIEGGDEGVSVDPSPDDATGWALDATATGGGSTDGRAMCVKLGHGQPMFVGGPNREFQWTRAADLDVKLASTGEGACYLTGVRGAGLASIYVDSSGTQWLHGEGGLEEAHARCLSRMQ